MTLLPLDEYISMPFFRRSTLIRKNLMRSGMSFSKTKNYKSAKKIQEFMFKDIGKSLELNNGRGEGAPAFLIALGLCCYTEYWGRLVLGISTGCSKPAFNTFLDRLDPIHYRTLRESGLNIYRDVRCGLAHSFVIENGGNIDADTEGDHGIDFDKKTKYSFYVIVPNNFWLYISQSH